MRTEPCDTFVGLIKYYHFKWSHALMWLTRKKEKIGLLLLCKTLVVTDLVISSKIQCQLYRSFTIEYWLYFGWKPGGKFNKILILPMQPYICWCTLLLCGTLSTPLWSSENNGGSISTLQVEWDIGVPNFNLLNLISISSVLLCSDPITCYL